jgi:Family of unknown function (DUF5946)
VTPLIACVGCGGLVPDEHGPVHRYMTAAPGCWRIYGELTVAGLPTSSRAPLVIDAYAVTHPGTPGPQSTASVWIHLTALCFILERGWSPEQASRLRRMAADAVDGWPWLDPPASMGEVSAVDVHRALAAKDAAAATLLIDRWVDGAWGAWAAQHHRIRTRADDLTGRFLD